MVSCKVCNLEFKNNRSVSTHLKIHNLTKKEYYDQYIKNTNEGKCKVCGHETTFRGNRYLLYCSKKCCDLCPDTRLSRKNQAIGKKQTKETIEKRIKNTDQNKKEETRQITMMERYSSLFFTNELELRNKKISKKLIGRKHTKEHHKKVIETKIKNNTLSQTKETKQKISESLLAYWQNNDIDHAVIMPKMGAGGRGYKSGTYNGIYYRSSYELKFLQLCEKYDIKVESAATKEFRIRYKFEDKWKYYYPDFYLTEYDIICEVKPLSMIDYNLEKIHNAAKKYSFWLVTEDELEEQNFINEVNSFEHILFR